MENAAGLDDIDDLFWDELLAYIEERRVVPVIDAGALLVADDGRQVPLETLLARRLAERLRLPPPDGDGRLRLDDVVRRQRAQPGRKENLYLRLQVLLKELALEPPRALVELAEIEAFDLFVTVSFDDLLQRALDEARHAGQPVTRAPAFAPNRAADLDRPRSELDRPTVFHLLGRISSSPDCVICDDDRLEFLHALQDDARRPKLLFDALRESHLLLLGCRLPDWAARFFLRTAKGERLSLPERDTIEVLVGSDTADDAQLAAFLAAFRPGARLLAASVEAFVGELHRRWRVAHPPAGREAVPAAPVREGPADGAVFISYSRHDGEAAQRLAAALRGAGVEVWFDRQELKPGDAWAQAILAGIENCALFLPVVSQNTQREERNRAYFWREWNLADDLALGMAPGEPFIVPVVIDDTDPYRATVPRRFHAANFARLAGGQPDAEFVNRVHELYTAYRRRIGHG